METNDFDYQYVKELKKGTQSSILCAKKNNKSFAVKVLQNLNPAGIKHDYQLHDKAVNLARGTKEIFLLNSCKHENIIEMIDIMIDSPTTLNNVYIIMPLMDYTLKQFIEQKEWRAENPNYYIRHIMTQLLRGLDFLHQNTIFHRDLSPSNVMLNHDYCVRIIDFEVSREFGKHHSVPSTLRKTDLCIHRAPSTKYYLAPERILCLDLYDSKVDVWSAGCIFAELITGQRILFPVEKDWHILCQLLKHQFSLEEEIPQIYLEKMKMDLSNDFIAIIINKVEYKSIEERLIFPVPNIEDVDKEAHSAQNGYAVLRDMLKLDFNERISAEEALKSPFFLNNYFPNKMVTVSREECLKFYKDTDAALHKDDILKLQELLKTQIEYASEMRNHSVKIWQNTLEKRFENVFGSTFSS